MCISLYFCTDNVKFMHINYASCVHVLLVTCVFIWSLKISVIVLALEIKRLVICQILMHWGQQLQCPFHWRNPQYRVSCISHVAMTFPSPLSKITPIWSHKVTFISLSTCMVNTNTATILCCIRLLFLEPTFKECTKSINTKSWFVSINDGELCFSVLGTWQCLLKHCRRSQPNDCMSTTTDHKWMGHSLATCNNSYTTNNLYTTSEHTND